MPSSARSRAIGQGHADDAALGGGVGGLADLPVERRHRGGVDDDAALALVVGHVLRHVRGGEPDALKVPIRLTWITRVKPARSAGPPLAEGLLGGADARAVDEHVQPPEARRRRRRARPPRRPRSSRRRARRGRGRRAAWPAPAPGERGRSRRATRAPPASSRSAVARPSPEAPPGDHCDAGRDLHAESSWGGWVRWRRSITVGRTCPRRPRPPAGFAPPRSMGRLADRSRRGPRGGHRHRGGQPASLPGQALPGAGRHRSRRRAPGGSPRLARSLRARRRAGRSRHVKIFHAADNDLAYLKRLYAFAVASIFDTAIAARFLGATALGLDVLLQARTSTSSRASRGRRTTGRAGRSPPSRRRTRSTTCSTCIPAPGPAHRGARRARPASLARGGVRRARRARASRPRVADPDAYLKLKGTKDLDAPRARGAARALPRAGAPGPRAGPAAVHDPGARDPRPAGRAAAPRRGGPPRGARVHGEGRAARSAPPCSSAIARGLAVPEADLPVRTPRPPRPTCPRPRAAPRRGAARMAHQGRRSAIGLDPGFCFPQRLIDRLAAAPPADVDALAAWTGCAGGARRSPARRCCGRLRVPPDAPGSEAGWPAARGCRGTAGGTAESRIARIVGKEGAPWPPIPRYVREGIIAGLIGAALVAVWFLIYDAARGRPFRTPVAPGRRDLPGGHRSRRRPGDAPASSCSTPCSTAWCSP